MLKYVIVFGAAIAILVIASVGRIPGTERQLATSEETRAAATLANTPTYTRHQAISMVADYIRESCATPDEYLSHLDRFTATWLRQPRTNDFYERDMREWTVSDPLTGAFWRLYEDSGEVRSIIGGVLDTC
ncbi:MAG: hypothetical protein F4Y49_06655 [Dehalococcoidia bacterium]|nr:hypothetical protein [Dehalococcoidia bacterium]MYA62447.1 hypothetical protein [Dehalococcoidia bacterium]